MRLPILLLIITCLRLSSSSSTNVIEELKSCLDSNGSKSNSIVVVRNSNPDRYNVVNYQYNSISEILPLAYIVPESTKDVQNAIRCGKANNVRIFAKSGGHSFEKYSYGDSQSIVLDLMKLSEIRVNRNDKTAQIGAGAMISEIYYKLWADGKYGIPTTSCTGPGIGGVALGGGYGFWSKRFGLTADNVLGMDFVDPQGNYLKVTRDNHPDLFWALLGGGSGNFGVVTKFDFKLFDASALRVKQILISFDISMFEEVFGAFQSLIYDYRNENAYLDFTVTQTELTIKFIDTDLSDTDALFIMNRFPTQRVRPASVKSMNFIELTAENSTPKVKSHEELRNVTRLTLSRTSFKAKSYFSNKILGRTKIRELKSSLSIVPPGIYVRSFGSFGGAVNRIAKDETSFFHRDSLYLILVGIAIPDQPQIVSQQQRWLKEFENVVSILDNGESYQNYADGELRNDFMQRYYGDNVRRLIEIKKQIDPDNYFAYDQSIPLRQP